MRYMTHQFAHVETLERARKWLVQAGIDPSRIEARPHAILNLAVAVKAGESAAVQCVFDVAESSDPDGSPSIWHLAKERHVDPPEGAAGSTVLTAMHTHSFALGWHPQDSDPNRTPTERGAQL